MRKLALKRWNDMNLESQSYILIKNHEHIDGGYDRHPHTLTGFEIEKLYKIVHKI